MTDTHEVSHSSLSHLGHGCKVERVAPPSEDEYMAISPDRIQTLVNESFTRKLSGTSVVSDASVLEGAPDPSLAQSMPASRSFSNRLGLSPQPKRGSLLSGKATRGERSGSPVPAQGSSSNSPEGGATPGSPLPDDGMFLPKPRGRSASVTSLMSTWSGGMGSSPLGARAGSSSPVPSDGKSPPNSRPGSEKGRPRVATFAQQQEPPADAAKPKASGGGVLGGFFGRGKKAVQLPDSEELQA